MFLIGGTAEQEIPADLGLAELVVPRPVVLDLPAERVAVGQEYTGRQVLARRPGTTAGGRVPAAGDGMVRRALDPGQADVLQRPDAPPALRHPVVVTGNEIEVDRSEPDHHRAEEVELKFAGPSEPGLRPGLDALGRAEEAGDPEAGVNVLLDDAQ